MMTPDRYEALLQTIEICRQGGRRASITSAQDFKTGNVIRRSGPGAIDARMSLHFGNLPKPNFKITPQITTYHLIN